VRRLPLAEQARVQLAKIRDYLLVAEHPDNGGKAEFFERFGFEKASVLVLVDALRNHPLTNSVIAERDTRHGRNLTVQCAIRTPDGRNPCIRSIWALEDDGVPRLVTAYPAPCAAGAKEPR